MEHFVPKLTFAVIIAALLVWVAWRFFSALFKMPGDKNHGDSGTKHQGNVNCIPVSCIPCGTSYCTCLPECPLCGSNQRNELVREPSIV